MDYLVHDNETDEHAIVEANLPIDAVQRYIGIAKKTGYNPDPFRINVFPITRKNAILSPVDPIGSDRDDGDF